MGQEHQFETHEPQLGGDFLVSCTPLRNASGELTGTVHVARDVTELRKSEAALRRAHEKLQQRRALVVAASLDGVWEWDVASEQVQYSDRFAELLGYSAVEIPQTLEFFRNILDPDDSELVWQAVERHLNKDVPYDVECRLRLKNGESRWFRTRGQAQRDSEGRPIWMAGSLQDIDDQKTAEADLRKALHEVERLTERLRAENVYLQEEIASTHGFDEIVGDSEPLRLTFTKMKHVADTDASVLLLGETGTGKELFARAIHEHSGRRERPLVKVNLAALPSSLIESELFGHVKGAFTGALSDKVGRFQLADGGTLFLDEIGELSLDLQTKLLRVLQEGEFERIGSANTVQVDVRVVAATNRDLHRAMAEEKFRPDLYFRLAVFPIEIPPLRVRREDIPLLVWHFIGKKRVRLGKSITSIPNKAMSKLVDYDWPGNVRELENVIERAMILSSGSELSLEESFHQAGQRSRKAPPKSRRTIGRDEIVSVLQETGWKVKGAGNAAERLGLKPSTLRYRMKVLGIQRPSQMRVV
jgi:PAS domain S-box-containing protein